MVVAAGCLLCELNVDLTPIRRKRNLMPFLKLLKLRGADAARGRRGTHHVGRSLSFVELLRIRDLGVQERVSCQSAWTNLLLR